MDLLQSTDFGDFYLNSLLMENHSDGQVWSFGNRIQDSQVGVLRAPMGMAARDLDGNGLPDLWFSNLGINLVFSQLETWSFTDTSVTWGAALPVEDPWTSWSVMDIDLDGFHVRKIVRQAVIEAETSRACRRAVATQMQQAVTAESAWKPGDKVWFRKLLKASG